MVTGRGRISRGPGVHTAALAALALLFAPLINAAGPMSTVRVGIPERNNIQYLTLWVALGAGYFQAEGLDPQIAFAERANQSGQLLLEHRADVALLQPPAFLGLIAQQQPIVLFANLLANDPINLVVRADVASRIKLDPQAPLEQRLGALRGLRIGVANEPRRRLQALCAQAGLDAERDIHVEVIRGEEQVAALRDRIVDALYAHTPYLEEALVDLGAVLAVNQSAGEVPAVANGEIHSLATTREYATAHADTVLAVTRAIARAETLIHKDPEAAGQALLKAGVTVPTPKHLARIIGLYGPAVPATPRISVAAIERDAKLYPARPAMPDFTRLRAADFLASTFAESLSGR